MWARSPFRTCHSANPDWQSRKTKTPLRRGFLLAKYTMLRHLDPNRWYTRRNYLAQWFDQGTLITDNDFEDPPRALALASDVPSQQRIIDITHNPYPDQMISLDSAVVLSNNWSWWYSPHDRFRFFPLFLWAYSLRKNLWWDDFVFDAGTAKTQGFMCLNRQTRPHRTRLYQLLQASGHTTRMAYSMDGSGLPDEPSDPNRNDVGVAHEVYALTAVNIVTETTVDLSYVSEKCCKPFVAHQIPVMVGAQGINQFLSDIGLDMFGDLVPWAQWDSLPDPDQRLIKIAQFVAQWLDRGTVLEDYHRLLPRIRANKLWFHSEAFRQKIMCQMGSH